MGFDNKKDNFGLSKNQMKIGQTALGGGMGLLGFMGSQSAAQADMQSAAAMRANATRLDTQADMMMQESAENQIRGRTNQQKMVGQADLIRGSRGMTDDGSGSAAAQDAMSLSEIALQDAAGKSLQDSQTVRDSANLKRWEASQMEAAARNKRKGMFGSVLGSAVGTYFGGAAGGSIGSTLGGKIGF
ncbi:MAG: hypothetical protein RR719_08505 [Akkermansia sp.]